MATASITNIENRPLTEQEQHQVPAPVASISDSRAGTIAKENFVEMWQQRQTQGHNRRWAVADELYLAWSPQKTWEGTRIPRASMGVYIALSEVEGLMSSVMPALFPLMDNVEIQPRAGSTWDEARAVFALLMTQFDSLDEHGYNSLREEVRKCWKQAFIYGNGILEVSWLYKELKRKRYVPEWVQQRVLEPDPVMGQLVPRPIGFPKRNLREQIQDVVINQPLIKSIDIRDFFIDPNCMSPNIQDARFCATRHLMTVQEIKELRTDKRFNIPSDAALVDLTRSKEGQAIDQQKAQTEAFRNGSWQPGNDYSSNPADKRIEVVRYWDRDRCTWLFNRNWVVYNGANEYGCLPFQDAFYIDVPGRFYGLAITDVVEGDQRYIQTIRQARADELALSIHAPFVKRRGTMLPQGSLRIAPGKVIEVEQPKEDLIKMEMPNITQNAYVEEEAAYRAIQKATGNSDVAVLGVPTSGGNSANRTAAGINTQAAATSKRIQQLVENLENTFVEPLLRMVHGMNQVYLSRQQVVQILGPDGQFYAIDPLYVVNASVKFSMKAGEKMRNRQMLMQSMPVWLPAVLNPEVLGLMQKMGQTLDMPELMNMIFDSVNVSSRRIFRPMNQQEMQAAQAPPAEAQMKMAMEQAKLQNKKDIQDSGDETELLKTMMQQMITPEASHMALGLPSPAAIEHKDNPKPAPKPAAKGKK